MKNKYGMKQLKNKIPVIAGIAISGIAAAQDTTGVAMDTALRSSGKMYVVVGVLTIILIGITTYLFTLDRKIGRLEKERDKD